jgi:hypothetical protein
MSQGMNVTSQNSVTKTATRAETDIQSRDNSKPRLAEKACNLIQITNLNIHNTNHQAANKSKMTTPAKLESIKIPNDFSKLLFT